MIRISNLTKKYRKGAGVFTALDNVSLEISKGEFLTITGPSGSGKSTLLHTVGGLVRPDDGNVVFEGDDIYNMGSKKLDLFRKKKVGFIFQQFHLLPYLTVFENISVACSSPKQLKTAERFISECSLTPQRNKYPSELSVGEKQRTAFIRAIISRPELLLADEPTGNLDPANSSVIMDLLIEFNKGGGTVMLVSHNLPELQYKTRSLSLNNGKIV